MQGVIPPQPRLAFGETGGSGRMVITALCKQRRMTEGVIYQSPPPFQIRKQKSANILLADFTRTQKLYSSSP